MNRIDAFTLDRQVSSAVGTSNVTGHSAGADELDLANLWEAYRVSRDESLRNRLLIHYLPLAKVIARHMQNRMPASVELDDLAQAAILGMRSAIATFDGTRGIPFENFCGPRVRGSVLDYLRSLDWAPRMHRSRINRVQEMVRQLEMSQGTVPTDDEVSQALGMPVEELRTIRGEMVPPPVRIRSGQEGDSEHSINLELLPDRGDVNPVAEVQRADLKEFLTRGLSETERRVIILYYYENMSLREIGETLGFCESRVSQIHHATIKRLRERMHRIGGSSVED